MTAREIRANSVLPATREPVTLVTADGLSLVGELATPLGDSAKATIVCVHPLPTAGGMMDSHLFRKASWRLPALAGIAVLRFNTRGTSSPAGLSQGSFDEARGEGKDVQAAVDLVSRLGLPVPWLVGWSFGTDVILAHPEVGPIAGAILLSPPLRYVGGADLDLWAAANTTTIALIPELDDYLRPAEAARRFAGVPAAKVLTVPGAKHLWVGEPFVRIALSEIVREIAPEALDPVTRDLPIEWDGPMDKWSDL